MNMGLDWKIAEDDSVGVCEYLKLCPLADAVLLTYHISLLRNLLVVPVLSLVTTA